MAVLTLPPLRHALKHAHRCTHLYPHAHQHVLVHVLYFSLPEKVAPGEVDDLLSKEVAEECRRFGPVRTCVVHEAKGVAEEEAVKDLYLCFLFFPFSLSLSLSLFSSF